ncbi:MAG: P1 family peptidase, partial [Arenicella sp.]|nr:P1 family peptidase [Arenicella sp.]
LKIAAFTVVNSYGLVVDRNGNTDSCYTENGLERELPIAELIRQRIDTLTSNESRGRLASNKNTTVSVLVVNQALEPSLLKRLAAQVHTSMGRYIQPCATLYDGDVFYVVSTAEIDQEKINSVDIGVLAGEVMWDAALSATPKQPEHPKIGNNIAIARLDLESMTGDYYFSDEAILRIFLVRNKLTAKAIGKRDIFAISKNPKLLTPLSTTSFTVFDKVPLILDFSSNRKVIVNPGPWQQVGLVKPN